MDPARLLHAKSQYGYTRSTAEALPDEPEAVSAPYQAELTRQAHVAAELRKQRVWHQHRQVMWQVFSFVEQAFGREVASELRALQRDMARLDRRLA
jgi:hypothetical protein